MLRRRLGHATCRVNSSAYRSEGLYALSHCLRSGPRDRLMVAPQVGVLPVRHSARKPARWASLPIAARFPNPGGIRSRASGHQGGPVLHHVVQEMAGRFVPAGSRRAQTHPGEPQAAPAVGTECRVDGRCVRRGPLSQPVSIGPGGRWVRNGYRVTAPTYSARIAVAVLPAALASPPSRGEQPAVRRGHAGGDLVRTPSAAPAPTSPVRKPSSGSAWSLRHPGSAVRLGVRLKTPGLFPPWDSRAPTTTRGSPQNALTIPSSTAAAVVRPDW